MPEHDDVLLEDGPKGRIVCVRDSDGSVPAEDFLRGLAGRAKAQFQARFEQICAVGALRTPEQYHIVNDPGRPLVGEIKAPFGPGWRLFVIREGPTWCLTHGIPKPKSDRQYASQVARARAIYQATRGAS